MSGNSLIGNSIMTAPTHRLPCFEPLEPAAKLLSSPSPATPPDVADSPSVVAASPRRVTSPYVGTYIGQVNYKEQLTTVNNSGDWVVPVKYNYSFSITVTFSLLATANGTTFLRVAKVSCTDPYFGARKAVVPRAGSLAMFPAKPANNAPAAQILINFPNGTSFSTQGAIHMTSGARILSNPVSNTTSSWLANGRIPWDTFHHFATYIAVKDYHLTQTWALTHSAK